MNPLDLDMVRAFVNENIDQFHGQKIKSLQGLDLKKLLRRKNPYLFRAKHLTRAGDLVESLLDAHLSSSEEKLFGDFLEALAIFIAAHTTGGRKSAATGIDLEFVHQNTLYLVSIKSGPNWGHSSQHANLEANFKTALTILKQADRMAQIQPVLGICYGRSKMTFRRNFMQVMGQNFWYLISENPRLYLDIIEPLGYRAREHNDHFMMEKDRIINLFTDELLSEFCTDGLINWEKLVAFNSGNLDLA